MTLLNSENRTDDKKIHADRLQSRLTDEINELKNIKIVSNQEYVFYIYLYIYYILYGYA